MHPQSHMQRREQKPSPIPLTAQPAYGCGRNSGASSIALGDRYQALRVQLFLHRCQRPRNATAKLSGKRAR
jgi:hypothetical protein